MADAMTSQSTLTDADLASLRRCGIPADLAEAAGLFRVDSKRGAEMVGRPYKADVDYAGIAIPYFLPNGSAHNPHIREYRVRRDRPDHLRKQDGTLKEKAKYLGPPGRSNLFYFPPGTTDAMLKDSSLDVLIVEGEKKALACVRALGNSVPVIAVSGVNNWKGSAKIDGPNGQKIRVTQPIQDFELINWKSRKVTILFDRDASDNDSVISARSGLDRTLRSLGAMVKIAELPHDGPDKGIDDLIGRVELEDGFEAACSNLQRIIESATVDGLGDFVAYLPDSTFIHTPDSQPYIAKSINTKFPKIAGQLPAQFLVRTNAVNARTWAPGHPQIIEGTMLLDGGWQPKSGYRIFNEYRPPTISLGDARGARPWLDHIEKIYPDDCEHLVYWLAHRVQKPHEKVNHAIVLGGDQGIGKDSILEPLKDAVGRSNCEDFAPHKLFENFNDYLQSVVLRISEARDMGESRRTDLYERLKTITAAPPDVIRINRKHIAEFKIPNLCGVVITTNHSNGLYLPPDDRRFFVAWSDKKRDDFTRDYWSEFYRWLEEGGGREAVAGYLHAVDLVKFDAKAPPPQTMAWRRMVDAGRSAEDADMATTLEKLGWPKALTLDGLRREADESFSCFLAERKNLRSIGYRFEAADYVRVPNPHHKQKGLWKIGGKYQAVYAKRELTETERLTAAGGLR